MKVTKPILDDAVLQGLLSSEQAESLIHFVKQHPNSGPSFDFTHVLYYLGGMLAIGAMTLFMNLGWETFGGLGIVFISMLYAGIGLRLTEHFKVKSLPIPAGICATFVVALAPLAIYGLQQTLGLWPDDSAYREYHRYIKWHWIYMELGTLAVAAIVLWRYKYPFLMMPVAITLWYMSMDLTSMLAVNGHSWELRAMVSMYFGLLMIGLAFWVDIRARNRADYAFWLYIFGVIAFWGGLSNQHSDLELSKFIYFCINLIMIGVGAILVRRVFVVFGAIGCMGYLGYLASNLFADSWLFPIALTLIGGLVVYSGVLWQKHEKRITQKAQGILPIALQELLAARV